MKATESLCFQLLSCNVQIDCEDQALARTLQYIVPPAQQPPEVTARFHYEVFGQGPFHVHEDGDLLDSLPRSDDVLFRIYGRAYARMIDRYVEAGWHVLHAGVVGVRGRRILFLGDKGAGKTTLISRLLFDGHQFEGDEMVMLRDGQALPVPRCLHLKPGIEHSIPELKDKLDRLPMMRADDMDIRALDPTSLGFDWTITLGPIDHVIAIKPNHGSDTLLTPLTSFAAIQEIAEGFMGWGQSSRALIGSAAALVRGGAAQLRLGDVRSAVHLIEQPFPTKN